MKRVLVMMIVVIVALVMASAAFAQDEPELGLGTKVISLAGQYQLDQQKAWNISAGYGQFITDKIEVGAVVSVMGAEDTDEVGVIGAAGKYHFISDVPSRTVPYIGLTLGLAMSGGESAFGYGAQAGLDFFMSAKQAVFLEYAYEAAEFDGDTWDSSFIKFGIKQYL